METIGASEATSLLPQLLERVARGETITITQHGVPVARLVPVEETAPRDVSAVIEEIRRYRKERPLGTLSAADVKEMINEGRRL
jgi:prevent-host-death family protein